MRLWGFGVWGRGVALCRGCVGEVFLYGCYTFRPVLSKGECVGDVFLLGVGVLFGGLWAGRGAVGGALLWGAQKKAARVFRAAAVCWGKFGLHARLGLKVFKDFLEGFGFVAVAHADFHEDLHEAHEGGFEFLLGQRLKFFPNGFVVAGEGFHLFVVLLELVEDLNELGSGGISGGFVLDGFEQVVGAFEVGCHFVDEGDEFLRFGGERGGVDGCRGGGGGCRGYGGRGGGGLCEGAAGGQGGGDEECFHVVVVFVLGRCGLACVQDSLIWGRRQIKRVGGCLLFLPIGVGLRGCGVVC